MDLLNPLSAVACKLLAVKKSLSPCKLKSISQLRCGAVSPPSTRGLVFCFFSVEKVSWGWMRTLHKYASMHLETRQCFACRGRRNEEERRAGTYLMTGVWRLWRRQYSLTPWKRERDREKKKKEHSQAESESTHAFSQTSTCMAAGDEFQRWKELAPGLPF